MCELLLLGDCLLKLTCTSESYFGFKRVYRFSVLEPGAFLSCVTWPRHKSAYIANAVLGRVEMGDCIEHSSAYESSMCHGLWLKDERSSSGGIATLLHNY